MSQATDADMEFILKDFQQKFGAIKKNINQFDLLHLKAISGDIIIFYKEGSQVPVHAVFLNFDCEKADVNFEINKSEILLDISAYFNNVQISQKF